MKESQRTVPGNVWRLYDHNCKYYDGAYCYNINKEHLLQRGLNDRQPTGYHHRAKLEQNPIPVLIIKVPIIDS